MTDEAALLEPRRPRVRKLLNQNRFARQTLQCWSNQSNSGIKRIQGRQPMVAMALPQSGHSAACVNSHQRNAWQVFWLLMGKREDIKKPWERDELAPSQKFDAYFEGVLSSFDFYPVCDRRFFAEKDTYALLEDFWAVSADVNRGVQELLNEPRSDQERERRAAKRALEAIIRAKAKRTGE